MTKRKEVSHHAVIASNFKEPFVLYALKLLSYSSSYELFTNAEILSVLIL